MAVKRRSIAWQPVGPPAREVGGWRSLLFAPLGDGQRRRRGSDGVRLAVAVLITLSAVLAVHRQLPRYRLRRPWQRPRFSGLRPGGRARSGYHLHHLGRGKRGRRRHRRTVFQQQGYDTTAAVTSGAVISVASLAVKGALFLIAIPLAWRSFHFGNSFHQGSHSKILWLILAVVCVVGAVMAAVLAGPKWRQQASQKQERQLIGSAGSQCPHQSAGDHPPPPPLGDDAI